MTFLSCYSWEHFISNRMLADCTVFIAKIRYFSEWWLVNFSPMFLWGASFPSAYLLGQMEIIHDLLSRFNGAIVNWFDHMYTCKNGRISVPTPNPAFYTVTKTGPALFFDEMLFENSVTITAETRVTLFFSSANS